MSDETTPEPLPALMGRVLRDMPAVGKNSQAPGNMGGYSFRGIEDVLAAVKPAMGKHGVFCTPKILERLVSERSVSGSKTMFVVDLHIEWTFYGPTGDTITADAWGEGTDMGDKATQKAMTSAFKSMLMQTFAIGDSASDSERHSVPETENRYAPGPARTDGWADADQEHDAHVAVAARLAKLPEDHPVRQAAREAREDHGWPMAAERLKALSELVTDAERTATPSESLQTPQDGQEQAPETVGDQPAPETSVKLLLDTLDSLDEFEAAAARSLLGREGVDPYVVPSMTVAQLARALDLLVKHAPDAVPAS